MLPPVKPEPMALAFVCVVELGGLAGWWPTWTSMVARLPRAGRGMVVAAVTAYLTNHWKVLHG